MSVRGAPLTPEPVLVDDMRIRVLVPSEGFGSATPCGPSTARPIRCGGPTTPTRWRGGSRPACSSRPSPRRPTASCCAIRGLSLHAPDDVVGHAGQALTLPAARGRHVFTTVKRYLVDWATALGLVGMYSEATAAHPYSQQALLDLGGHETGFMLGFIPEAVDNNAASPSSAARAHSPPRCSSFGCGRGRNGWSMRRTDTAASCGRRSRSAISGRASPSRQDRIRSALDLAAPRRIGSR